MLEIQKFLRDSSNKPEDLTSKLGIAVKPHAKYPNLFLFKYSMIDSPLGDPIVQESRGIILDSAKDWAVVSFPYKKFFNYGEHLAATIDWSTAIAFEKLDGSLMTLYWYDNQWNVASSGIPDAGATIYGTNTTFKELFWKVWNDMGYNLPSAEDRRYCYMFEICTPYNKQVVQHKTNKIVLHGIRDVVTLKEHEPHYMAKTMGWSLVKSYPLQTMEDVLKFVESIPAVDAEGCVVCDANFNRIKVKSSEYVNLHHMRDGMGTKRMLEIVRSQESDEFLNYFPEFKSLHAQVKEKYETFVYAIDLEWKKVKDMPKGESIEDIKQKQKEFAMTVKDIKFNGILFGLRSGIIESIKQGVSEMKIKNLMEILKIKEIVIEV